MCRGPQTWRTRAWLARCGGRSRAALGLPGSVSRLFCPQHRGEMPSFLGGRLRRATQRMLRGGLEILSVLAADHLRPKKAVSYSVSRRDNDLSRLYNGERRRDFESHHHAYMKGEAVNVAAVVDLNATGYPRVRGTRSVRIWWAALPSS